MSFYLFLHEGFFIFRYVNLTKVSTRSTGQVKVEKNTTMEGRVEETSTNPSV